MDSKLTFRSLRDLVTDMKFKRVDKERFSFTYAKQTFDCILSFRGDEYELLVGIHALNYGFVVDINSRYVATLKERDYYNLRGRLGLTFNSDHFTSNVLLNLLSSRIPASSAGTHIVYSVMRDFVKCRNVEKSNKIFFCGWNDHTKDGRTARNFDKTEFFLGKTIADYCRAHNISSMWSDVPRDEKPVTNPWP